MRHTHWNSWDDDDARPDHDTGDDDRRPPQRPGRPGFGGDFGGGFGRGFGGPGFGGPGFGGGRGRRQQPGPPPWVAGLLGFAPPEPHRRGGGGGGPKVRRGDVRSAILDVLAGEPRNGYQVINEIAERSHGEWRPSPGSVYPTIQQLEDEGLVTSDDERGRRTLRLTEEGEGYVADHLEELAAVWRPFAPKDEEPQGTLPEIGQVMSALWQIVSTGTDAQRREALEVLTDTRRRLYGILAEGDR
ncbi:PadR family transcriptional regulator [Nocardioides alkalitolerans]|uniref:PadR family transcriptional regulator n=1 Tax=Nocardioides alkalitolerans TaxID=281714 RepID=UPI0003F8FE3B|nr:PadR family transcriptional regulator [Nocardioides alkalitolerans]